MPVAALAALLALGAGPAEPRAQAPAAAPPPAAVAPWTALPSGLELRRVGASDPGSASPSALLLRLDPARHCLRVVAEPRDGKFAALRAGPRDGALAALNGGYFDATGRPLGWLVSRGVELSPPRVNSWAALVVREDGKAAVVRAADLAASRAGVREAVQAGPRLVVAGKPNTLKPQAAVRSFVGIDAAGRIVLGTTSPAPAEANALARLLAAPEREGGAGLVDALNLDGGGSTQLWVRAAADGSADLVLPGLTGVPDLLVVEAVP